MPQAPSCAPVVHGELPCARSRAAQGRSACAAFAAFVDRMLPIVPRGMGEKLVALSVESAAIAGYDRDDPNRSLI